MLQNILENEIFIKMMKIHAHEILELLFQENLHFSILVNVAKVDFEPPLPDDISRHFKPMTMLALSGYTYESAMLDSKKLVFEAGFGRDSIGSLVSVPLSAILQIIIDDTPIFINLSLEEEEIEQEQVKVQRSMEAFLSNPENQKLFT